MSHTFTCPSVTTGGLCDCQRMFTGSREITYAMAAMFGEGYYEDVDGPETDAGTTPVQFPASTTDRPSEAATAPERTAL